MSNSPESEFDLELHFLPAWAHKTPETNRYADHPGDRGEGPRDRRERRGRPDGPRRDGPRRDAPRFGAGGGRAPQGGGRRQGGPREDQGAGHRNRGPQEERPIPQPLPELEVAIIPDDRGVESLAKQIRMTGRAYPLFEIAQMILKRPERHLFRFTVKKNPEGQPGQPLFVCVLDESPWLSEEEAVQHVLGNHFETFYQTQRTPTEPPKGTYTFVAQCGLSGTILGPPNHHDYQNNIRKLHAEKFSRMPFEAFKARIKIVRDEAVVKKWLEDQSFKTEYVCLNMPEPLILGSRQDVEKHFRTTHLATIVRQTDTHQVTGASAQKLRCSALLRLVRHTYEQQRRFPLQIATVLSHQFADQGLQFFKVNKSFTHVAVARPHFLDLEAAPVSDRVKGIVTFIDAHPKCSRRQVLEGLLPQTARGALPTPPGPQTGPNRASDESASTDPSPVEPVNTPEPSPEQNAIIADLHWLIHQGHVIEFANGLLETAKKLPPRPVRDPKPARDPKAKSGAPSASPSQAAPQQEGQPASAESTLSAPASTAAAPEDSPVHEATASSESKENLPESGS